MSEQARIRIHDLANPEYSESARNLLAMFDGVATEISVDAVYAAARQQLGDIEPYSDAGVLERLGLLCEAFDQDADLSPMGRYSVQSMLAQYLVQRSRLEDLYRRHPEIDDEEIVQPLIITGFPRSGTTHLLNLISVDEQLRSLRYWESLEPIPSAQDIELARQGEDPRIQRCRDQLAMQNEIMPLFNAMHEMTPEHIHEEIELLAMDFSTVYFETRGIIPRWSDYYASHDQTPHYAFLKRALKALQWLRGPRRWVLKSPQHMEQLVPLKTTFPDATFVLTHRDPTSVLASLLTMLAYSARMSRNPVRPKDIADAYQQRMLDRLRRYMEDRDLLPPEQSIDVVFHEFMQDDMGTIEKIYRTAGLPLSDALRKAMQGYVDNNPRGRHGQLVYDLKGDFGIDVHELRASMSPYYQRFGIKIGA